MCMLHAREGTSFSGFQGLKGQDMDGLAHECTVHQKNTLQSQSHMLSNSTQHMTFFTQHMTVL